MNCERLLIRGEEDITDLKNDNVDFGNWQIVRTWVKVLATTDHYEMGQILKDPINMMINQ